MGKSGLIVTCTKYKHMAIQIYHSKQGFARGTTPLPSL
nr:MAG TPA: hypothetical protein [Caudoviricetes sp.]